MEKLLLEDCCEILDSMRVPITSSDRVEGPYPYYGANGIQDHVADYIFDDELVLLAEDGGNFGSKERPIAYRVSGKCWVNNHAHVLKPKEGLDVDYLCYSLMFYNVGGMVNGATRQKLTQAAMRQMLIPKRTMEEQKYIVDLLVKVVAVKEKRQQELTELDNLIKARFVELFGDININDKGWDIEPLGNLCTIVRGGSPRPIEQFLGGDVPWIKIGDATDGDNIYLNSTKEHIIQEGVKKSRLVKAGSLIFANCGVSLGFARIITFDGCIHDGWLAMEDIDERLDKVFLLQTLNQMTEHFRAIAPAGTQPNLNTAIMKAYRQVLPPLELQKEFIAFAKQVDKSKVV
ncbi:restriction endonuclease subunit S [Pseudobutyrivibrio sp.]|uniref:restriction endonuclease subunit S n=1 Tax=Pseudobutyrivibrio sp. TaxID=2014367 RepID=UPI001D281BD5|nr:restriction endonuclease subunit S [Pseudobutyrivibrio sp.]MBE5910120.1 restriction endonuclease subunit S [Pseudobutyrivibrio sp.]